MTESHTVLAHPPVKSVVLQVYFPNNLGIGEHRSKFYESIKDRFPNISVPQYATPAESAMSQAAMECDFLSTGGSEGIRVALNSFTYGTGRHEMFSKSSGVFEALFKEFAAKYTIRLATGYKITYSNAVTKEAVQIVGKTFADFFTVAGVQVMEGGEKLIHFNGSLNYLVDNGLLNVAFQPDPQHVADMQDFRYEIGLTRRNVTLSIQEGNLNELQKVFFASHHYIKRLFLGILTQKYTAYVTGG